MTINRAVKLPITSNRCSKQVYTSGDGISPRPQHRCRRLARYQVNGESYCVQHAGETALKALLNIEDPHPKADQKPSGAEYFYKEFYYRTGKNMYAYYYNKGTWRESGSVTNKTLYDLGEKL